MKLLFKIHYFTQFGQTMQIAGLPASVSGKQNSENVSMQGGVDGNWFYEADITATDFESFEYKYVLYDLNTDIRFYEWGENRRLQLPETEVSVIQIQDYWRPATRVENSLYSSAFTKAIFNRNTSPQPYKISESVKPKQLLIQLSIMVSRVESNNYVAVKWNTGSKTRQEVLTPMHDTHFPVWSNYFTVNEANLPFTYRYCICSKADNEVVLEEYQDRSFEAGQAAPGTMVSITDEDFKFPRYPWKGAGVAIPVFSLRTQNGMGVGEFNDLKLLVDWAKKTGLKMIQILPVNDTIATHSWTDSYPYAAISVFALHPMYLNLDSLGILSSKITQEIIYERRNLLNSYDKIDYEAVMQVKARFIKMIYDEQRTKFLADSEYKVFFKRNKEWLVPYAVFCYLRDLFGTTDFNQWGKYSKFSEKMIKEIADEKAVQFDDIAVHYYQQYHLHKQLQDATQYARQNGVVLKGDIPIGIYRESVDAWVAPQLYNMNGQAGAPPDDFSDMGQNWGFPTYNWDEMAKDNFAWWRNRLTKLSEYFDAFRIDHILGFFRIWQIPINQRIGIMGMFNPAWAVHKNDFYHLGINFDYNRFCKPFIRDYMLYPLFGNETDYVKIHCLTEYEPGQFTLNPEFNDQAKIEKAFTPDVDSSPEEKNRLNTLKNGLFYLVSEVLFFEAPFSNGDAFHPRHSFFKTYSFKEFDYQTKNRLMTIYNDYFYQKNEHYWHEQAMVKLPALKNATNMLICGEDLGMVPACVPHVMNDLGILSLEVQRMPKNPKHEFGHPAVYPYMSVATPSSHDTSTIRGWWEEDPSRSQRFYTRILGKQGNSPFYCEPWLVKDIIVQHLYSPAMWAVFPVQDFLGMDEKLRLHDARAERINQPANPKHYWRYRMHISLEQLLNENEFNMLISNMLNESGRREAY